MFWPYKQNIQGKTFVFKNVINSKKVVIVKVKNESKKFSLKKCYSRRYINALIK
jgi:hypothetical protein